MYLTTDSIGLIRQARVVVFWITIMYKIYIYNLCVIVIFAYHGHGLQVVITTKFRYKFFAFFNIFGSFKTIYKQTFYITYVFCA